MRNEIVWKLWKRMPLLTDKTEQLWIRFNEVINRKFGPPS